MTGVEASKLANDYRATKNPQLLAALRTGGWKRLAELLEQE